MAARYPSMNPHRLNHFNKVANEMNDYVVSSAYNYYQNQHYRPIRNHRNDLIMYQKPSLMNSGLGDLLAYGLNAIGMPSGIVNLGHRFGYFLDMNA